jgi:hypothetical protein
LFGFDPDIKACRKYVAAILEKHHLMYLGSVNDVEENVEFQRWVDRCSPGIPVRENDGVVVWSGMVKRLHGGNPFSTGLLGRLQQEGLDFVDANASQRKEKMCCGGRVSSAYIKAVKREARCRDLERCSEELLSKDIVLGYVFNAHLGDCMMATTLPRKLKEKYGIGVRVVRHHMTIDMFKNNPYVDGHLCKGRIPLGRWNVGKGHLIQRMERYFGLDEDPYPRPEIYLSDEEQAWAASFRSNLPDGPVVVVCCGAVSNNSLDPFDFRPWQVWADLIGEEATVVQLMVRNNGMRENRGVQPGTEEMLEGHISLGNLPRRLFFAVFSVADGYFGTWAAGSHVAAAFGLPSIVHLNGHLLNEPVFPASEGIGAFLYPQHLFVRYRHRDSHEVLRELSSDEKEDRGVVEAEYRDVARQIRKSFDAEMKVLLDKHEEKVENGGLKEELVDEYRMTLMEVWRLKREGV